jgi:hypothetical protein
MQACRTGKIGRAGRGDKVHTGRGQAGKKTVGKQDPKSRQTQNRQRRTGMTETKTSRQEKWTVRLDINTGHAGKSRNKQKRCELRQESKRHREDRQTVPLSSQEGCWQAGLTSWKVDETRRRVCLLKASQEVQDKR